MIGNLIIRPQWHPTANGDTPLTYGIFLETTQPIPDLHYWQGKGDVFLAYSHSRSGAERAVVELRQHVTPPPYSRLQLMTSVRMTSWQYRGRLPWWRRLLRWVRRVG